MRRFQALLFSTHKVIILAPFWIFLEEKKIKWKEKKRKEKREWTLRAQSTMILTKYAKPAPTKWFLKKYFYHDNTLLCSRARKSISFSFSVFFFVLFLNLVYKILDCANQVHTNINILFKNLNRIQLQTKSAVDARRRRKVLTISVYSAHWFVFFFGNKTQRQKTERQTKHKKYVYFYWWFAKFR